MKKEVIPPPVEGLKIPEVKTEEHKRQLKLTLFEAKKSAALTVWLVAVPCFFLFAVFMKHYFRYDLHIFTIMEEFVSSIDRASGFPMSAVLLVGFPLIAIVVNTLAILHVALDRDRRELVATLKLRWINVAWIILSLCIVAIFMMYALVENIRHTLPGSGL